MSQLTGVDRHKGPHPGKRGGISRRRWRKSQFAELFPLVSSKAKLNSLPKLKHRRKKNIFSPPPSEAVGAQRAWRKKEGIISIRKRKLYQTQRQIVGVLKKASLPSSICTNLFLIVQHIQRGEKKTHKIKWSWRNYHASNTEQLPVCKKLWVFENVVGLKMWP